jgi:hypothetical protein
VTLQRHGIIKANLRGDNTPQVNFSSRGFQRPAGYGSPSRSELGKVSADDLNCLVENGTIKIITPDDAFNIIKSHPKKKISQQAGNIRHNMQRNNELEVTNDFEPF